MTASSQSKRRFGLAAALVLTLGASAWVSYKESAEDEPSARPTVGQRREPGPAAAGGRATSPMPQTVPEALTVDTWAPAQRDAWVAPGEQSFAAWAPPPPPPPPKIVVEPPAPPPPPVAPAFPYQMLGRLVDGDQAQALLAGPVRSLAVKAGDVVDGQWRIDQVHERGLNLTWLPGKLPQTLAFRASFP